MKIHKTAKCSGHPFPLAFTPHNTEGGFSVTGVWPVNSDIFTDEYYLLAYVIDRVNEQITQEIVMLFITNL